MQKVCYDYDFYNHEKDTSRHFHIWARSPFTTCERELDFDHKIVKILVS